MPWPPPRPGPSVTLTTDPAGAYAEGVPVGSRGNFRTQLRAPNRPGAYTLVARSSGTPPFVARTAFEVEPPPPPAPGRCANPNPGTDSPEITITRGAGNDVIRATPALT